MCRFLSQVEQKKQHASITETRQPTLEAQLQTEREALERKEKEVVEKSPFLRFYQFSVYKIRYLMGNTFLESVALKIDLMHLLVLIVPQMCCVHFYYVTIYLCSGLFGCDIQKGKTRQKNYSGQKHLPFSVILWSLALRICQSLSLIHVHLVHKHLVANNELNQSFSPEQ